MISKANQLPLEKNGAVSVRGQGWAIGLGLLDMMAESGFIE